MKISKRFKKLEEDETKWIRNPFSFNIVNSKLFLNEKERLIDISSDQMLKVRFKSTTYQEFWLSVDEKHKDIKIKAINILVQFFSTYLCATGFSKLVSIKTKQRARLNSEDDLRLAISKIDPEIEAIICSLKPQS